MLSSRFIAVDWLQIWGLSSFQAEELPAYLRWQGSQVKTRFFQCGRHLERRCGDGVWRACCFVQWQPSSPVLAPLTVSIKFDNALLYRSSWWSEVIATLADLWVYDYHITRCDLAVDFLRLGKWTGSSMARALVDGRLLRQGSRKMAIHALTSYKIDKPSGAISRPRGGIQSVTFGTHGSVAQWQLYNKSEELRQHTVDGCCVKGYIHDCWRKAGVYSASEDTWRIEVRLSSAARSLVNKTTGEARPVTLASLHPSVLAATCRAVFRRWSVLYDTAGAALSSLTHVSRLRQVEVLPDASEEDAAWVARVDPPRAARPSRFTKAAINFVQRCEEEHSELLAEEADAFILRDAASALRCIYNSQLRDERRRQRVDRAGADLDAAARLALALGRTHPDVVTYWRWFCQWQNGDAGHLSSYYERLSTFAHPDIDFSPV